ncbi:F-box only protein 28 isoform X1 [Teleopsis dalmanni]|uniref:F-box only protein 28 isoform X1 n=1 Tax=Teleopsis dalmanni TaxID=139649 RepID=UPI000D32AC3B|nr:F-box only protein 28 isoform X1 [Teleopsis dalmanni]
MEQLKNMNLLDLPNVILVEIFEYLCYEEVSKKRLVCRRIDQICQRVLTAGFNRVVRQHSISSKRIKSLLPRRESERRNHCLARHADILTSIETRISMLSMTYGKYMDLSLCCFIPGRVLDEIFRILRLISKTAKQLRPHEVLQELRDISSMAIEHFDEKIVPLIKKPTMPEKYVCKPSTSISLFGDWLSPQSSSTSTLTESSAIAESNNTSLKVLQERVNNLINNLGRTDFLAEFKKQQPTVEATERVLSCSYPHNCKDGRAALMYFRKLEIEYKKSIMKIHRMQQFQVETTRQLQQTMTTVNELSTHLNDVKKRLLEVDAKNRELTANIKQMKSGELPSVPDVNVNESTSDKLTDNNSSIADCSSISPITAKKRRHTINSISEALDTSLITIAFKPLEEYTNDAKKPKLE